MITPTQTANLCILWNTNRDFQDTVKRYAHSGDMETGVVELTRQFGLTVEEAEFELISEEDYYRDGGYL